VNNLNPIAINLWLVGGSLGYTLGAGFGCALGLAITSSISFLMSL